MEKLVLKPSENIKDELKKMILNRIDFILDTIRDNDRDIHKRIHEIRKSFKVIRAILRLFRDSVGYSVYYRENIFFRDLSRKLSVARDNEVLLERAEVVLKNLPVGTRDSRTDSLREELEKRRDESITQIIEKDDVLGQISEELNHSTSRIDNLKIKNEGFEVIHEGLERIYRQSRKYLHLMIEQPDPESIHNFRKRVKYLWYQLSILKPVYSRMLKAYSKTLENISDEIGLHRDYTLFLELMEENNFFNLNKKQEKFIREFTDKERDTIFSKALEPSEKFFLEKPTVFANKINKYYELALTMRAN